MVNLKINNISVSVPEGTTILEAAKSIGINIPTLCYMKGINEIGACRICVVEVKGARSNVAACVYPVNEGMEVFTNTPKIRKERKTTLELIMSDHKKECLSCVRDGKCELQTLAKDYGCEFGAFSGVTNEYEQDNSTSYLVRDNDKCILCRRCVATCQKVSDVGVIETVKRGFSTHVACAFEEPLSDTKCVACGQCINVCPVGALSERSEVDNVLNALADPEKVVVVGAAPSVRAGLGEEFGYPIGTNVEGKMVQALRLMGFNYVFDVNFAADLTILEEGTELLDRLSNNGTLPMITSCSPGWIKYLEGVFPELIPNLSTCKSPQQMFGAVVKTFYAEKLGIDPKNIYVVSVMPCTAKKFEKLRADQSASGYPDIDAVLTTRELARAIKSMGIIFNDLPDGEYDMPLGLYTGAGVIFGSSGGVMEAALRTVADVVSGSDLEKIEYEEVRGMEGIKKATYKVGDKEVKVAVASGLTNARKICEEIRDGKADYQFVEIMCCPGGCINGGGQPILDAYTRRNVDYREKRASVLYDIDKNCEARKSHKSTAVDAVYKEMFEKPGSHKAHEVLHTSYVNRKK